MKFFGLLIALLPSMSFASVVIRPSVSEGFFVCNAGIAHKVSTGTTCTNTQTGLACSSSDESSCVCSNSKAGQDAMAVAWEDLTLSTASSAHYRSDVLNSDSTGNFASLFTNMNAWNNQISTIKIDSSSETYGTKYFVDFCYQGPIQNLVKKNGSTKDASEGIYTLTAGINGQNLSTGAVYATDSNLAMTMEVNCDLRNTGKLKDARTANQFAPTGTALESDINFVTTGYPRSSSLSVSQRLNSQSTLVPRFCVIRATFAEMANSSNVKVRPNNQNPTEFTVDLDITNGSAL